MEGRREFNLETYFAFIDYENATNNAKKYI